MGRNITIACDKQPLRDVINEISNKTNLKFIFIDNLVDDKLVTCDFQNISLEIVLQKVLQKTDLSYRVYKEQFIILSEKKKNDDSILGSVIDAITNQALPYANVFIKGTSQGTISNEFGEFEFTPHHSDPCTLMVCYIGYDPLEFAIDQGDDYDAIKAELRPTPVQTEPITVTSDRIPIIITQGKTGAVMFFPNEIKFLPTAANNDILHTLQLMPGTKNVFDQLDGLYIQKGTPDQNLLLFDGITVIRGEHLWGYLNAFSSQAIKSVTMHKAGFSSRYGGQLSSIIELEGDAGNDFQLGGHLNTFYADGYLKVPITSKCRTSLSFRRSMDHIDLNNMYYNFEDYIFLLKRRYQTDLDHGNMFKFHDAVAKIEYGFTEKNEISITAFNTCDKIDITKINATGGIKEGQRFEEWENKGIGVNWKVDWHKLASTDLHASYSQYKNDYFYQYQLYFTFINTSENSETHHIFDIPIEESDRFNVRQQNYRFNQSFQVNAHYSMEFGCYFQRSEISHRLPTSHIIHDSTNTHYKLNIYMPIACDSWSNIVYLENNINVSEGLRLTLGLRSNFYSLMMKNYLDPRIAISWDINNFQFNVKWGQYHQYLHRMTVQAGDFNPMRTSYYWMLSYSHLPPESAEHTSCSMHYQFKHYEFSIDAYNKNYGNLVEMAPGIRFTTPDKTSSYIHIDTGRGNSRGIELLAKKNSGLITGWISYQLSEARFRFNRINRNRWYSADYDRTHEVKLITAIVRNRWNLSCINILASGVPYSTADHTVFSAPIEYDFYSYTDKHTIHGQRLPSYFRTDIKAGYNVINSSHITISAGFTLFNMFNQKNIIDYYYAHKNDFYDRRKSTIKELGRTFFMFFDVKFK